MEAFAAIFLGLGGLIVLGLAFLVFGDRWAKRAPSEHGDFFPTLHLIALVAAIVGAVLAWMAFVSDHPSKWRHLGLSFVFVAIVYGYALRGNKERWILLAR